jgi:hypothetical protein
MGAAFWDSVRDCSFANNTSVHKAPSLNQLHLARGWGGFSLHLLACLAAAAFVCALNTTTLVSAQVAM